MGGAFFLPEACSEAFVTDKVPKLVIIWTSHKLVLQAIHEVRVILRSCIEPGERDGDRALNKILGVMDRDDLIAAVERLHRRKAVRLVSINEPTPASRNQIEVSKFGSYRRCEMGKENDGKPWSDDDLFQLKILITENTPTDLIAGGGA